MNIKTTLLTILVLGFLDTVLYSQEYPSIQNDFESEISDFILSQKEFKEYDFILLKYAECYWFDKTEYKLLCFSESRTDLIEITKKKKNDKIKIGRKYETSLDKYYELIDSLSHLGLFELKESDLQTELINEEDGSRSVRNISDGIVETFEVYSDKNTWGLSVYEAIRYYEFCRNENLILFNKACRLFDKTWKNIN